MDGSRRFLGKAIVKGNLTCETGMHIGASKDNMEIGAIDAPVVRDPVTREPYIPGSSLKGKLRMLLEKVLATIPNRRIGSDVKIHVCDDAHQAVNCEVCRMFGSTGKDEGGNFPSRLIIRDLHLTKESAEKLSGIDTGLQYTEWKFENALDRVTSAANPRQIERVPRGAEFSLEFIYNVEEPSHVQTDLKNLRLVLDLLQLDTLGGHGSRGYGKVRIQLNRIEALTVDYLKDKTAGRQTEIASLEDVSAIVGLFNGQGS